MNGWLDGWILKLIKEKYLFKLKDVINDNIEHLYIVTKVYNAIIQSKVFSK